VPIYWGLQHAMGVNGLALASSIAITLYTAVLAVVWYRRTGRGEARPVAVTALRNLPLAAFAGLAAWAAAEGVLGLLAEPGFWPALAALAAGGVVLVAMTLGPPWVRRDLR